jgi:hypothetical protein
MLCNPRYDVRMRNVHTKADVACNISNAGIEATKRLPSQSVTCNGKLGTTQIGASTIGRRATVIEWKGVSNGSSSAGLLTGVACVG